MSYLPINYSGLPFTRHVDRQDKKNVTGISESDYCAMLKLLPCTWSFEPMFLTLLTEEKYNSTANGPSTQRVHVLWETRHEELMSDRDCSRDL